MIWQPKPGQRVRIHYRKSAKDGMPYHGLHGTVEKVGRKPGPINALIRIA